MLVSVSLHLKSQIQKIQQHLESLLLPDSSALLIQQNTWLSIYAEQLSEQISDIEELAVPLSSLVEVIAVIADKRSNEVYVFSKGALQSVSATIPTDLPASNLNDYETVQTIAKAGLITEPHLFITREAEKPGLAEFFGRSEDE